MIRIATLNLEQDHKLWAVRRDLIVAQVAGLSPDFWALNEIHIPSQSGRWLKQAGSEATSTKYALSAAILNAAPDQPSIRLMSAAYRATQTQPTAFTPLREPRAEPTHPEWQRFDRCIDYIWVSESIKVRASGLCFNQPAKDNAELWPSDHVGVWADLEIR